MNLYLCSHTKGEGYYTYYVEVIADDEQHAREIATDLVKEKSYFGHNVEVSEWNVSFKDSDYSGPARVKDYDKR